MTNRTSRPQAEAGFTLVELLVVIVILGILSAVAVFAVRDMTTQGKKSACLADVKAVQTASEAYFTKHLAYAADIDTLVTAKLLRSPPGTSSGYTITYTASDGSVSSTPACSTFS